MKRLREHDLRPESRQDGQGATDTPAPLYTLLALCPSCDRRFILGIHEDDIRALVDAGTTPQQLSQTLISLHRSRQLMCLDCTTAAAN